jgi:uncharacterized protein
VPRRFDPAGPLQFTRDSSSANVIQAWEPGRVRVGDNWLEGHFIVAPDKLIAGWRVSTPAELEFSDLAPAIALSPEIILLGTGSEQSLPDIELMSALAEQRIGLEIMSSPAACRTYNVLVHEHRRVVAAIFNPG